ncbi:ATP-binding cassette domain-containing protein [Alkalihalobacterium bogoriense]|uniref:ATP-binding cassette domain-containing protein n=1 Tax=Alkalihalobacterium bogoriense TaxID=246272 RepID=UPI00047EDBB0|nr:ABC transporter ATP-binding protein [Alkalihalobacterium bogoriense]
MIEKPLLQVTNLQISILQQKQWCSLVQDVSFSITQGETVALTGPSGCGKSITAQAIVGLLDSSFKVTRGKIIYEDRDVLSFQEKQWLLLRRQDISLFIQHSLSGLDPIRTVRKQMLETVKLNQAISKKEREFYLSSLLEKVGFHDPELILSSYPFELSGGMRQRVLLALVLSLQPKVIIADEPTTALDVVNREKVIQLFKSLQQEFGLTLLLISHDEQSVKKIADRVLTMERGGILT